MAQFTTSQIELVERLTGHSIFTELVRNQLTSEYTETVVERALEIITEIESLDLLLKEARETSYVTESRGSKLSYSLHVKHLKGEGSRLLKELAYILKIDVIYNKYIGNKKSTSYW
ncbi:hypothetical protein [Nostoc sp. UHCC 0870]|uniref:hypothetical protein n=1 Tax=Nostoc sp. UHCC 0870 TaxID=2914041 RepID=UPI001EDEB48D|nr:hypothetical protein [Nostoc sp. UHCC 0870]UKO99368.1 hypothetical protein L6494_06545 [Nostoc sp. UHCC 0870]